jgi:hypothetical protein
MSRRHALSSLVLGLLACGGSDDDLGPAAASAGSEVTDALPLAPDGSAAALALFMDASGFMTDAVFDADREIVHFDVNGGTMLDAATGESVSGWTIDGAELDWVGSNVPFQVRFGSEDGQRRAYFTERREPGTICNLRFPGGGSLFISATSQLPPNP